MEQKRCEFLRFIEDWNRLYGSTLLELGIISSFVDSLHPSYQVPSPSIVEIFDQTNNPDLGAYLKRGCQKAPNSLGWNEAYQTSNAYDRLIASKEAFICMKSKLQSIVEDSLASTEQFSRMDVSWRIHEQTGISSPLSFSAFDVLLLMAAKLDNIEKEHQLLATVIDSVSIFSQVAELKAHMIILKLRPYDDEQTIERLKTLEPTLRDIYHIQQ